LVGKEKVKTFLHVYDEENTPSLQDLMKKPSARESDKQALGKVIQNRQALMKETMERDDEAETKNDSDAEMESGDDEDDAGKGEIAGGDKEAGDDDDDEEGEERESVHGQVSDSD
jgi:hypothetical protein